MHEPLLTVTGNVAVVPSLRELSSGTRVAGFRLAHTPRRQDKATGEWSDGTTLWFGVTCWRSLAEHTAQSLKPGDRVVVTGKLSARTWTSPDGEERSGLEIDATSVGFDLTRTAAAVVHPASLTVTRDPGAEVSGPPPEEPGQDEPVDELAA